MVLSAYAAVVFFTLSAMQSTAGLESSGSRNYTITITTIPTTIFTMISPDGRLLVTIPPSLKAGNKTNATVNATAGMTLNATANVPTSNASTTTVIRISYDVPDQYATTSVKVCGNTLEVCNVEVDIDLDGKKECCAPENHPMCRSCLDYCKRKCMERNEGVRSCFGDKAKGYGCECTKGEPLTCYNITAAQPSGLSVSGEGEQPQEQRHISFLTLMLILLAVFFGGIFYLRRL